MQIEQVPDAAEEGRCWGQIAQIVGGILYKPSLRRRSGRRRDGVDGDMEASAGHTERAFPYQRTDQKGIVGLGSRSYELQPHGKCLLRRMKPGYWYAWHRDVVLERQSSLDGS